MEISELENPKIVEFPNSEPGGKSKRKFPVKEFW